MNFTSAPSIAFSKAKKTSNKIVSKPAIIIYQDNNYHHKTVDCHFMGITASKRSIKKAVERNLVKRRLRVIFTNYLKENSLPKMTVIFIVRTQILKFSFATLQREIIKSLNLIKLEPKTSEPNGR
ncbi:ribonuclease P protein component [Rickettsiales bacterium]|nr:ribonuclease P protein component [Rickettsiales bacterium]